MPTPAASPAPVPTAVKAAAKPVTTRRVVRKKVGEQLPADHTPGEAIAFAIRTERADLAPSVNRIMNAGLDEAGTLVAITLFRDSLGALDDPNRNPTHAIETARLTAAG